TGTHLFAPTGAEGGERVSRGAVADFQSSGCLVKGSRRGDCRLGGALIVTESIYAKTLERLEDRAGLTYEDVARVVGSSPRSISRWARGDADPRSRSRDRLLETAAVVN